MILLALLLTLATETSSLTPEEFRQKINLDQMCVTKNPMDSGYKEVGLLNLTPGPNVANVAVTNVAPSEPAMFEKGVVTAVRIEKEAQLTRYFVSVNGERASQPAHLDLVLTATGGPGLGVSLSLSAGGKNIEFFCFPAIPKQTK